MLLTTQLVLDPFPLRACPPQRPISRPIGPQLPGLPPAWFAKCNRWPGRHAGANLGRKNPAASERLEPQLSFPGGSEKSQEKAGLRGRQGRKGAGEPCGPLRIARASCPRLQKRLQLEL